LRPLACMCSGLPPSAVPIALSSVACPELVVQLPVCSIVYQARPVLGGCLLSATRSRSFPACESRPRFQRLLSPGLACAAPPAYKNRAVAFVISNQNLFCQASLGLGDGRISPPRLHLTRPGGFVTSQPGVIGRLPEIGRGSSCFYRPESHRRDAGCQLSATCQAQQTEFFTQ
jgi:hypothetical protein